MKLKQDWQRTYTRRSTDSTKVATNGEYIASRKSPSLGGSNVHTIHACSHVIMTMPWNFLVHTSTISLLQPQHNHAWTRLWKNLHQK
ncbi:unnamed protein product [Aphanomyces euteiches]